MMILKMFWKSHCSCVRCSVTDKQITSCPYLCKISGDHLRHLLDIRPHNVKTKKKKSTKHRSNTSFENVLVCTSRRTSVHSRRCWPLQPTPFFFIKNRSEWRYWQHFFLQVCKFQAKWEIVSYNYYFNYPHSNTSPISTWVCMFSLRVLRHLTNLKMKRCMLFGESKLVIGVYVLTLWWMATRPIVQMWAGIGASPRQPQPTRFLKYISKKTSNLFLTFPQLDTKFNWAFAATSGHAAVTFNFDWCYQASISN